ncbi:protein Bride of doubletime isoform X1 [Culicoides brevitarsis]|uniref:protein Bride of doubletime isoform X1 n=1 Tax=Culicoides brevitarsis TaxID=469753 RepID=UPI00307C63B2
MVTAKKQKKALESINARLALVMKSGKYCLGYKQTLKTLRQGKAKLIIIANNTPHLRKSEEISFTVSMKRIEHGGDWHEKSFSEILTLAKQYKEHGVKMFKQFPVQFAHFYFAKAAKCLLMYKPFGDLEERAKNENVDASELIPLLRNIYTNIAACLLKQNRINDVIDLLGFVEWAEEPVPEKAVYRLATAYFSKKDYDKARDVIKKLPNYAENKELMALLAKINQESKAGDEKYANMVKKMFQ